MTINPIQFNHLLYEYDGALVSSNLDYTFAYQIEGIPLFALPISDYQEKMTCLLDAKNQLEEGIQVSFVRRNSLEHTGVVDQYLEKMDYNETRRKYIQDQFKDCRSIDIFLFITSKRNQKIFPSFFPKDIFQKSNKKKHEFFYNKLKKNSKKYTEAIKGAGVKVKKLSLDEVGRYCFYHLNHRHESNLKLFSNPFKTIKKGRVKKVMPTIREQVLNEPITLFNRCIKIGNTYIGVVSIEIQGEYSFLQFFNRLEEVLPSDNEVLVSFEKINKDKFFDRLFLNQKEGVNQDKIRHANESEYESGKAFSKRRVIEDQILLMREVNELNLECFKVSISISVRESSEKECVKAIQDITQFMRSHKMSGHLARESYSLTPSHFHAFLPGNAHQLSNYLYMSSLPLLYYLPINAYSLGYSKIDGLKRANQIYKTPSNEAVLFHSFYYGSNYRVKEITATTGSGKTFDIVKEIDGILSENTNQRPIVLAVEPKRGLLRLTRTHEGEIVSYNPGSTKSYNPFPYKKDLYLPKGIDYEGFFMNEDRYDPMLLSYFENLIEILVKEPSTPTLSRRMKGIISTIIVDFYDQANDTDVLILEDIINKIESYKSPDDDALNKELNRVKGNLEPYLSKQYQNMFHMREPMNIHNDLIYFDLSVLEETQDLKEMCMYVMGSWMIRKLRIKNRPTYLFLDEASIFYESKTGAKLLSFFVRQSRSLGGSVTIVTQSAQDKLKSDVSDIVMENLSVRKCLYLSSGHEKLESVGYSKTEIPYIQSLKKKPGFFVEQFQRMNGVPMLLKSDPDPFLYWMSSNDERDDALFLKTQESMSGESISNVIARLGKTHPNGSACEN